MVLQPKNVLRRAAHRIALITITSRLAAHRLCSRWSSVLVNIHGMDAEVLPHDGKLNTWSSHHIFINQCKKNPSTARGQPSHTTDKNSQATTTHRNTDYDFSTQRSPRQSFPPRELGTCTETLKRQKKMKKLTSMKCVALRMKTETARAQRLNMTWTVKFHLKSMPTMRKIQL